MPSKPSQSAPSPSASTDRQAWEMRVKQGLKTQSFDDLTAMTEDGLPRGPLFTAQDRPAATQPIMRSNVAQRDGRAWHSVAPVRGPDLGFANAQMLADLAGGASALRVETDTLPLKTSRDVKRLFEGVYTDLIPIHFTRADNHVALVDILLSMGELHSAHIRLGCDPVKDADLITAFETDLPEHWRAITVRSAAHHDGGATDAQELTHMALHIAETFRTFGPEIASKHIHIELASGCDVHMAIAKFRAARRIYATIAHAFGANDIRVPITAITALRMMQKTDAWTNLLRVMSAGFGAVTGGADYVLTRPLTDGLGQATPFGHRTARNMQNMMAEESRLGHVDDPAHGSYFHEAMTETLAQAAWSRFQEIEANGGVRAYDDAGGFEAERKAATTKRDALDAPIVGVTLHPDDNVTAPDIRAPYHG